MLDQLAAGDTGFHASWYFIVREPLSRLSSQHGPRVPILERVPGYIASTLEAANLKLDSAPISAMAISSADLHPGNCSDSVNAKMQRVIFDSRISALDQMSRSRGIGLRCAILWQRTLKKLKT